MVTGRRQGRRAVGGALLILATIGICAFIAFLDDIIEAFTDGFSIVGVFPEATALDAGTPVWIAGRPAGAVTRVEMLRPGAAGQDRFAATLRIRSAHAPLLRRDSELTLMTPRLLSDPVVNLMPGSVTAPPLAPGDTLVARRPLTPRQVLQRVDTVRRALADLELERRQLAVRTNEMRPAMQAAADALQGAGEELQSLALAAEHGSLSRLSGDTAVHATLARIRAAAGEIASRAEARIARTRDPALADALRRLSARADTLGAHVDALRAMLQTEPHGFSARWQTDPALRNALAGVRVQVDSIVAEARRAPWRWVF